MRVFIIAALSADGFIGQNSDQRSLDWRSKADARFFIETTKKAGVMVMGSTTYKTFRVRKAPPGRKLIVYTTRPGSVQLAENIETTDLKPAELIENLDSEGFSELAVCGGAQINTLFLKSGLVDELYLTVEPVVFGSGVPVFSEPLDKKLTLLDSRQLAENTMLLHYAVDN